MKLCAEHIPSLLQNTPMPFIVCTFEDNLAYTNSRHFARLNAFPNSYFQLLFPQAVESIYAADLLFHHGWIPFQVQQDDGTA